VPRGQPVGDRRGLVGVSHSPDLLEALLVATTDALALAPASPSRALLEPTLEQRDLPAGPRAIARHAAIPQSSRDRLAVSYDVIVGPEVKCATHGRSVAFAKQWPDIRLKSNW